MTETKDIALTGPAEKAFPSASDMSAWMKLSAAEKRARVAADEAAGFASGAAPFETAADRIARVRDAS